MPSVPPRATTQTSVFPPSAESPCIKLCLLDLDRRCRGCGRTIDEITQWSTMTQEQRIAVNARLGFVPRRHD